MVTVTAALIVRNEEEVLGRCLASIKQHVDEIVVVDTGSEDGTIAVARQFTDVITGTEWVDDFSAARTMAFSLARSDWVFWLDADDEVEGAEYIRQIATSLDMTETGLIHWLYVVARDERQRVTCQYWRERMCRRGQGTWRGRVHETLWAPGTSFYDPLVVVNHRPPPGRDNLARNIRILEEALQDEGESPRLLYYLGRDYARRGVLDRAITLLVRYLPLSTWEDEKYMALCLLADLFRREGEYAEAVVREIEALAMRPDWPMAYFGLARSRYFAQDWAGVIQFCEVGMGRSAPRTTMIVEPRVWEYDWLVYYAIALYHTGRVAEALSWTRRALEIDPSDPWHRHNQQYFLAKLLSGEKGGAPPE